MRSLPLLAALVALPILPAAAQTFDEVVQKSAGMVQDPGARELARRHGLDVLNVTWEDTGRFKGSAVGPNISDMTIQVQSGGRLTCMPVIRFPNFADQSADLRLDEFLVPVGNERGLPLERVSLRELLANLRRYLTDPLSWKGKARSLLAERDTHALVSAQACFLPVPRDGAAEFNPVLFNYQSSPGNPAVLTILVTREGTSVTIIDNQRDRFASGGSWGQRLFFNKAGQRASFTGQRLSDWKKAGGAVESTGNELVKDDPAKGLNQVLLIQVPLKHRAPRPMAMAPGGGAGATECPPPCAPMSRGRQESDVEEAVVGHGEVEGPFTEIDGQPIERDERFPVRVTVQFYKATSNGAVSAADLETIARQIKAVYAKGDAVGSLVTEGETGRRTEHDGPKVQPPGWWADFWAEYERTTGITRDEALRRLRDLVGPGWAPRDARALRDALDRAGS